MSLNADEQPLNVEVRNGEVVITGPRVAIALHPHAAAETAHRLMAAVDQLGTQRSLHPNWAAPHHPTNDD